MFMYMYHMQLQYLQMMQMTMCDVCEIAHTLQSPLSCTELIVLIELILQSQFYSSGSASHISTQFSSRQLFLLW